MIFTDEDVSKAANKVAQQINAKFFGSSFITFLNGGLDTVSAVVRSGLEFKPPVVLAIDPKNKAKAALRLVRDLTSEYETVVIEDLLDSGTTVGHFETISKLYRPYFFLIDKTGPHRKYTPINYFAAVTFNTGEFIDFPWEQRWNNKS